MFKKSHKNHNDLLCSCWCPSASDFVFMTRGGLVQQRWVKQQVKSTMHGLAVPDGVLSTAEEGLLKLQRDVPLVSTFSLCERKKKKGVVFILDKVWVVTCRWLNLCAVFSRKQFSHCCASLVQGNSNKIRWWGHLLVQACCSCGSASLKVLSSLSTLRIWPPESTHIDVGCICL